MITCICSLLTLGLTPIGSEHEADLAFLGQAPPGLAVASFQPQHVKRFRVRISVADDRKVCSEMVSRGDGEGLERDGGSGGVEKAAACTGCDVSEGRTWVTPG